MRPPRLSLPEQIETERLVMRPPRAGDGEKVYAAIVESLDALREFPASLSWAMAAPSVEALESFCRSGSSDFAARRGFPLLMLLRGTDIVVGSGGLHRADWSVPRFEIGWWGRTPYVGRGLISEGVMAMLEFAFSNLRARRVEALPDDLNERSCRICERLGMELEGVLRHERVDPSGTLRNTRVYAMVR